MTTKLFALLLLLACYPILAAGFLASLIYSCLRRGFQWGDDLVEWAIQAARNKP